MIPTDPATRHALAAWNAANARARAEYHDHPHSPPRTPCPWCHHPTTAERLCQTCRGWRSRLRSRGIPTPDDALTGGRWVLRGGVQVWETEVSDAV